MSDVKNEISTYFIPVSMLETCLIDGVTRNEIINIYPTRKDGAYYIDKFIKFLKDRHNIDIKEYSEKYLDIKWPVCPSKFLKTGFRISGKGIKISKFAQGAINKKNCPKFSVGCQKLSQSRKGSGNPMYGREAWNKGMTKDSNSSVLSISQKMTGRKVSDETRVRQRISYYKNPKIRHNQPHSEKTKLLMREITAKRYSDKIFKRESSIHVKVREFLNTLNLLERPIEEFFLKYYSLDFAFESAKIAIEVQGTFFHVDPRIYPNGPICNIQKRNFGRDKAKKTFLSNLGWKIVEIWESEINDGSFKNELICRLKELNLLKESDYQIR